MILNTCHRKCDIVTDIWDKIRESQELETRSEDVKHQHKDFAERIKRLGKASFEEVEKKYCRRVSLSNLNPV